MFIVLDNILLESLCSSCRHLSYVLLLESAQDKRTSVSSLVAPHAHGRVDQFHITSTYNGLNSAQQYTVQCVNTIGIQLPYHFTKNGSSLYTSTTGTVRDFFQSLLYVSLFFHFCLVQDYELFSKEL